MQATAPAHLRNRSCCLVNPNGEAVIGRVVGNSPSPSMLLSDQFSRSNNHRACQANIATHCRYYAPFGSLFTRIRSSCLLRASPLSVLLTYRCHIHPDPPTSHRVKALRPAPCLATSGTTRSQTLVSSYFPRSLFKLKIYLSILSTKLLHAASQLA